MPQITNPKDFIYTVITKKGGNHSMEQKFINALIRIEDHLEASRYSYTIKMSYRRAYRLLGKYLDDRNEQYNNDIAKQWLQSIPHGFCRSTMKVYQSAIKKLDAAYHELKITNTKAIHVSKQYYQNLNLYYKAALDTFLSEIATTNGKGSLQQMKVAISRFLTFLSTRKVFELENITHRLVIDFYNEDKHDSYKSKDVYNNGIRRFLHYLTNKNIIKASIPLTLNKFVIARIVIIQQLPDAEKSVFVECFSHSYLNASDFYQKTQELDMLIKSQRYSKTMIKFFRKAWKELFVFLEANSVDYSITVALAWACYMRNYTVQWKIFRRAVMLFEQYRINGHINPQTVYSYQADRIDALPEWCKVYFNSFMESKAKDGYMKSTLVMYRSCCLRLLEYVKNIGIKTWEEITPEIIKEFHRQDPHATPEGKNAYASRIRSFLEYLGEIGCVPQTLFLAVPNDHAPSVNIIEILDDTDISGIHQHQENAYTGINLRDAAINIIGLRMGIRASDIVNLTFQDLSWEHCIISFQQQKTGTFIKLPMPIEVGNVLYRYIMHGRPEADSKHIFVNHRVPYDKLHPSVCRRALSKAIKKQKGGFHIVRKTFASRMLTKNVAAERIAETLGHINSSSVMTYLATNNDKMRLCALPLSMIPVNGGGLK